MEEVPGSREKRKSCAEMEHPGICPESSTFASNPASASVSKPRAVAAGEPHKPPNSSLQTRGLLSDRNHCANHPAALPISIRHREAPMTRTRADIDDFLKQHRIA